MADHRVRVAECMAQVVAGQRPDAVEGTECELTGHRIGIGQAGAGE